MPASPRRRDAITDVPGLRVGHWTDRRAATGCTVLLCPPEGAAAAGAVLGGAPGTRETDVLLPGNSVKTVNAVLLTGGSAFGLDAAAGVMRWLREAGHGFRTRTATVPIVPAAVLYDLGVGRADAWPDAEAGYAACTSAGATVRQGSVGAGTGASVAKLAGPDRAMKGGLGTASERTPGGATVGALVAVNAVGEIVDPETGRLVAGLRPPPKPEAIEAERSIDLLRARHAVSPLTAENTTIGVVATDVALDREQLLRLALMAHTGLARAIRPSHTPADGDTVFALSTGRFAGEPPDLMTVGALAALAMERAVVSGVRHATSLAGLPGLAGGHRVRPIEDADRHWIDRFTEAAWGAPVVVSRGVAHRPATLPGFVALLGDTIAGVITLHVVGDACEVVTINSRMDGSGAGTALFAAAISYARDRGCRRLWLITTNDNTDALRFYQRRGMRLTAVHTGAVDAARQQEPEIPRVGRHGSPIHDEIELTIDLDG